ncbi:hypothetical protein GCM10011571_32400 [Marinithermofilum abyssi]|uniref:Uncharacterized protein n=1 Tax=Marinithermofilum abyssi TaxID=1571185 RepID=A0A8J2VL70_9BACL|nr:hypothetical protein GCM10011571_32400 [Marinithermofilum abyssi]
MVLVLIELDKIRPKQDSILSENIQPKKIDADLTHTVIERDENPYVIRVIGFFSVEGDRR